MAGARVAVEESPSEVDIEVVATSALTVEEGIAAGMRILSRPERDWPDGIFAANDLLALGLLQSLVGTGRLLVPQRIALIGFDDIAFARAAAVPLSSMRQPSRAIGRTSLRVLLEESNDPTLIPRQTVYQPELVVRESTRAPV